MKRIIAASAIALCIVSFAVAQATPTSPALPKASYTFTQWMDFEGVDGAINQADFTANAPIDEYSQIKTMVALDLGGGMKLLPYVQDRFEGKFNVDQDIIKKEGGATTQTDFGGTVAWRNRFYAGLGFSIPVADGIAAGANIEYRIEYYLRPTVNTATESIAIGSNRIAPTLNCVGAVGNFYFNVWQGLYYYLDPTATLGGWVGPAASDGNNHSFWESEGNLVLGMNFPMDTGVMFKAQLDNYNDWYNFTDNQKAIMNGQDGTDFKGNSASPSMHETVDLRAILATGDISPFVGPFFDYYTYNISTLSADSEVVGVIFGSDVKIGSNATFNVTANYGVQEGKGMNKAQNGKVGQPETEVQCTMVIKG